MTSSETIPLSLGAARELDALSIKVRPKVLRYVSARIRNVDHREEVISRVFQALVRSWSNFRGECPPEAFVLRIAANAVKNYYERDLARQSRNISLENWCEEFCLQQNTALPGPHQQVHARAEVEGLLKEIHKVCSPVECTVVELVYQGNTMEEIATLLDMKPVTVRTHVLRGRGRLLAHLVREAPDFLGGTDAVFAAVRRLRKSKEKDITDEEIAAINGTNKSETLLRQAMIKIAPYLGLIAILTWAVRA